MDRKWNVGLSIAAGLLGGFLSHYISPVLVHEQAQAAPKEIRAQRFVLVNDSGSPPDYLDLTKTALRTSRSSINRARYFGARVLQLKPNH